MQDGSITANPTGGTPPYTYLWSNQETGQTISSLAAGYYRVEVKDDLGAIVYGEVTLTEPEALQVTPAVNTYSNGYNISCYNCFNGSIALTISGGTAPYTHLWSDGSTNKNRWNLGPGNILVVVTDANGCEVNSETMYLNQPERSDWTLTGNSGSNASANFIGTTDSVTVSFRSNNTERLKINANGKIKVADLTGNGYKIVYADSNGVLSKEIPGGTIAAPQPWMSYGNTINNQEFFGTLNNMPIVFKTNSNGTGGGERMRITETGNVGIGTATPQCLLHISDAILNEVPALKLETVGGSSNPNIEFKNSSATPAGFKMSLNSSSGNMSFYSTYNISGVTPCMTFIKEKSKVFIGEVTTLNNPNEDFYKLYVSGNIATREVKVTQQNFPDYVFANDYKPISIYDLELYIKQYKHLPDVPTAKEVEQNNGFEIGKMQELLLKKIEEQTLYIIDLQKQIDELRKEMEKGGEK